MSQALTEWINQTNWLLFVCPPFGLWLLTGVGLLGFTPVLRRLSSERSLVQIAEFSLKRAFFYKWELLSTAISLTLLSYIYQILQVLGRKLLPDFPDSLASTSGFLFLFLCFLAKLGKIVRLPPTNSPIRSMKYIFGGFSNPFRDYQTYKVLEDVDNE